jgi:cation diffusion facilitator family transporter
VVAVSFATYSLWLSRKPPDSSHLYGHDKIAFFSAGFEGAMIVLAAFYIVYVSIQRLIAGPKLENLGAGALLVLAAGLINGALGGYLVWIGKKHGSLILEADGKHVLTDCLTSLGVVVGLGLTMLTGWLRLDPMVAIFVALDILWMGSKLIRQSIGGLMDEVDPITQAQIRQLLIEMTSEAGVKFHGLRHRNAGNTNWVEFHLLFPKDTSLESAHSLATKIEERIQQNSTMRTEVISHLETLENHHEIHRRGHFEKFDE